MSIPIATPVYRLGSWEGNVLDDFGCAWVVEDEDGWSKNPPVLAVAEDRTGGDGAWTGPGQFGPRTVTLSGRCICPDHEAMLAAKDRIAGVASVRDLTDLVVEEAHLTRRAAVRLSDPADPKDQGRLVFSWSFSVTAGDPRRYAIEPETGTTPLGATAAAGRTYPRTYPMSYPEALNGTGWVTIVQAGNYDRTPGEIRFRGPVASPGVHHLQTGRTLTFAGLTLSAADELVVDLGAGTAILNGAASRVGMLSPSSAWFLLVRGVNEFAFRGEPVAGGGGGEEHATMTVIAASAWR